MFRVVRTRGPRSAYTDKKGPAVFGEALKSIVFSQLLTLQSARLRLIKYSNYQTEYKYKADKYDADNSDVGGECEHCLSFSLTC